MSYEMIKVEEKSEGEITEITLNQPPANILSAKMMKEIETQVEIEEKNSDKKLIIFSGEGKHFSFGASVEEHKPEYVADMLPSFHRLIGKLIKCKVPTLAKVSGLCLGGGFELAMACTYIFTDEKTKFAVPEITLGVFPPVAAVLLPFKIGDHLSSQIIMSGETFTAKYLSQFGLINKVTELGKLDEAVSSFFSEQIQPKSAKVLQITAQACSMVISAKYEEFIGKMETLYLKDLMSTKDAVEGITAFIEKRKPEWKNS